MTVEFSQLPDSVGGPDAVRFLYGTLSRRRRVQLAATLVLMVLGAFAELMTIGATLPFLALIADPGRLARTAVVGTVLRRVGAHTTAEQFLAATVFLVAAVVVATVVRLMLTWVSQKFAFRLGHDISMRIYERLLYQPYEYHVLRNTAEVLAGLDKVHVVVIGVLVPGMLAITSGFMAIVIVATLLAIDPAMALTAAGAVGVLYLLVSLGTRKLLLRNSQVVAAMQTARVQQLQEGLGGIRDILIGHSQPTFIDAFRRVDDRYRNPLIVTYFIGSSPRIVVEAFGIALIAALALYMSGQPGGVLAAIPVLGALAIGAQRLLPLLQQTYTGWSQAVGSQQSLVDVVHLMDIPTSRERNGDGAMPTAFARDIVLDGVGFAYRGHDPVLRGIDLTIAKGQRIGFVGQTGSGKSTLIDLMIGLLGPTEGAILVDGTPLTDDARTHWQRQIAHVPQAIYLADGSVAANIAFGERPERIDMDAVRLAADRAQIRSFIDTLPDGFDTRIGERGVRLSGGQRQRLGIARAFYQRKPVLVLDEATSALDDETERSVMASIAQIGTDTTVLMIAHRLSTLASCDQVVRLDAGRIVQAGTFAEVVGTAQGPSS